MTNDDQRRAERAARLETLPQGADDPAVDAIEAIILRMLPVEHEQ